MNSKEIVMIMNLIPMTPFLLYLFYYNKHDNPECRAYELLVIHLDENLSFNYQTNFLSNKLTRSLLWTRAKNLLTPAALKTLYYTFINSLLNCCPIILSSISRQNFNQIKLIFLKSIRVITNSSQFWCKNLVNQGDRPFRNADNFMLLIPQTELFKKSPLYSLLSCTCYF